MHYSGGVFCFYIISMFYLIILYYWNLIIRYLLSHDITHKCYFTIICLLLYYSRMIQRWHGCYPLLQYYYFIDYFYIYPGFYEKGSDSLSCRYEGFHATYYGIWLSISMYQQHSAQPFIIVAVHVIFSIFHRTFLLSLDGTIFIILCAKSNIIFQITSFNSLSQSISDIH